MWCRNYLCYLMRLRIFQYSHMVTYGDHCLKIKSETLVRKKKEVEKSDVACQAVSRHVTSSYVSSRHFRKYSTALVPRKWVFSETKHGLTEFIRRINAFPRNNEIIYRARRKAKGAITHPKLRVARYKVRPGNSGQKSFLLPEENLAFLNHRIAFIKFPFFRQPREFVVATFVRAVHSELQDRSKPAKCLSFLSPWATFTTQIQNNLGKCNVSESALWI